MHNSYQHNVRKVTNKHRVYTNISFRLADSLLKNKKNYCVKAVNMRYSGSTHKFRPVTKFQIGNTFFDKP